MGFKIGRISSFKKRIMYSMAIIIVTLVFALSNLISFFGVFDELYISSYRSLVNQVESTASSWNSSVQMLTNNVDSLSEFLHDTITSIAQEAGEEVHMLYRNPRLLEKIKEVYVESITSLFQMEPIAGVFIIFNESTEGLAYSAIYIRRNELPDIMQEYYQDMVEVSNYDIFSNVGAINLSDYWKVNVKFAREFAESDNISTIYNTIRELIRYDDFLYSNQLGYWIDGSRAFFEGDTQQYLANLYIVPLIDENGNLYGIYGVEISKENLSVAMMQNMHMRHEGGFYVLGIVEDNVLLSDIYLVSNSYAYKYISNNAPIKFERVTLLGESYKLRTLLTIDGRDELFYVAISPINTRQSVVLEENESWAVIGFAHESEILREYRLSRNWVFISLAAALFSGIGMFVIVSFSIIKKITALSDYVRSFQGDRPFYFEKTNIYEVDELAMSICNLNNTVLESGNRLSKILEMTKLPIGCFEDKEKSSVVFVTPKIFEILGIDPSKYQRSYVPKKEWDDIFFKILRGRQKKNQTNIYRWEYEDNPLIFKWLKLESSIIDDRNIGVIMDVTKDILEQEKLEFELDYDGMTKLLNRKSFKRMCTETVGLAPNKFGAMIFADLDNLKYANDTYGHDIGDKYIIGAAEMFSAFKEIGGLVARMSGDEFAIYIHGFDTMEEARSKVYEYIGKCRDKTICLPDKTKMPIKSSLGIAWYGVNSKDMELLLKYSDHAMYETKLSDKGAVSEFCQIKYDKNVQSLEKKEALSRLIEGKLIRYTFQPIIDLKDGSICGYEALMRPLMDEFKSPLEILSVATAESKLYQIEKLTITMVIEWVKENRHLLGSKKIFINTFSGQGLNSQDLEEIVDTMIEVSDSVVYEITEGGASDPELLKLKISIIKDRLQSMLALDNFGTGYANELMIISLNPDIIKLDRELVSGIFVDTDKQQIVKNLVSYCKEREIKIIAEGVEMEQELGFLIDLGVDMAQGYYFGHPSFELQESIAKVQKDKIMSIKRKNF